LAANGLNSTVEIKQDLALILVALKTKRQLTNVIVSGNWVVITLASFAGV